MSITDTSTHESFARADGADDFLRLPDWNNSAPREAEPNVFERLKARMALMADAGTPEPPRPPSPPGTLSPDDIAFDGPDRSTEWYAEQDAAAARHREATAPTIDHKPTITLFDSYGNERVLHHPLAEAERFDPAIIADAKKRARWEKWLGTSKAVRDGASMNSMMRFACRVIDDEIKEMRREEAEEGGDQPKKKGGKGGTIPDHVKAKIEQPAKKRQKVKERLEKFVQAGPKIRADRTYLPFDESFRDGNGEGTALRSRLGIRGLELFNQRLPKKALVGYDKRGVFVGDAIMEPIFVRDMEYITIGWYTVRGQIVVDLDRTWPTLKALRADLVRVLGLKLLPTLIVYRLNANGHIEKPHLLWILPPGSEVGICGNSKPGPVRTFNMVQQSVVSALIELGADTGHENTGKHKNPLAPRFSVACTENFPDLRDFIANLPTVSTNKKEMRRRKAKHDNVPVEELTESQLEFKVSKEIFLEERARARRANDREFKDSLATPDLHAKWLRKHAVPRVIQALGDTPAVRTLLQQQVAYWSGKRPSKKTRQYEGENRGRDLQLQKDKNLVGADAAAARKLQGEACKKLAGTVTRAGQGADSRAIIDEQLGLFARIGGDLDDDEAVARFIIKSGKLGKSTVYKWLPKVLPPFRDASRYIASPAIRKKTQPSILSKPAMATVPSAPVVSNMPVVHVASAASTSGKPGQDPNNPCCQPAAHASSAKTCRQQPSVHPADPTRFIASTDAAELPADDWLNFSGQLIPIRSAAMIHADHDTIQ
jgi:hypothetical protein